MKLRFVWFVLLLVLIGCQRTEPEPVSIRGNIFGTYFVVSIGSEHRFDKAELEQGILAVLDEVDRQMSIYRPDSELNRLNKAPVGEAVSVPDALFDVLQLSKQVSEQSGGAFDFTVGGLVNLWGFGAEGRITRAPDEQELQRRRAEIGYQQVTLDPAGNIVIKQSDVFIDLGGIAKGYGVDTVSRYLLEQGLENHLVTIGGDLIARGKRNPGRKWRIGIEMPDEHQQFINRVVAIQDRAMVGSGDYRNYFEEAGVRYSHTIDPATGRPIKHRLAAVHVLADTAAYADGLATAMMVLGEQAGLELANRYDIAAVFIFRHKEQFEMAYSERFQREYSDVFIPDQ